MAHLGREASGKTSGALKPKENGIGVAKVFGTSLTHRRAGWAAEKDRRQSRRQLVMSERGKWHWG
jgi:hypothetical protein